MTGEIAIALPLLPGKRLALGRFIDTLLGERCAEYEQSQAGGAKTSWFLQATAGGDLVIMLLEAGDASGFFARLALSSDPFDIWFREQLQDLTGLDLTRTHPPTPSRVFHWSRG